MTAKKTTLWLACGVALATVAAAAAPGPGGPGRWTGPGCGPGEHPRMERMQEHHLERMTEFLDLSPQQAEQWRQVMADHVEGRVDDHESMRALHEHIRELAQAENPDPAAVGEAVIEAHRRMASLDAEREAFHAELESILTPEQRERFEAWQELRPERGPRGHFGHGRDSRRGDGRRPAGPAD